MNCKQGDRAVIVRGLPLNMGRVVRVTEPAPDVLVGGIYMLNGELWHKSSPGPAWICESLGGHFSSRRGAKRMVRPIRDAHLMPLPPESTLTDEEAPTAKIKEYT